MRQIISLLYKMKEHFRTNKEDVVIGLKISTTDLNKAAAPNKVMIGCGTAKITVSESAPVNPEVGDLWVDIS